MGWVGVTSRFLSDPDRNMSVVGVVTPHFKNCLQNMKKNWQKIVFFIYHFCSLQIELM